MERNIIVSMSAEVVLKATEEEEKIIEAIENSNSDDEYDELQDKLETLLCDRLSKEVKEINGTGRILEINW